MSRNWLRVQVFLRLILFALVPILVLFMAGGPAALRSGAALSSTTVVITGVLAIGALGWILADSMTRRLDRLLTGLGQLRDEPSGQRIFLPGADPLAEAAAAVNQLADQLEELTGHMDEAVARRTAALERKAGQLRAVGEVGRQVAAVLETEVLLRTVTSVVRGTFGYDAVAVLLGRGDDLEAVALAVRAGIPATAGVRLSLAGNTPAAIAYRQRAAMTVGVSPVVAGLTAQSEVAVPITLGERLLGVLLAQSRLPDALDAEDRFTLETLAGQVAVALENGRLLAAERQLRAMAVVEERNRMAREIHDTLAQGFMGILLQTRLAEQTLDNPDELKEHLAQMEDLANRNLQEARRSIWNLRPRPLEGRTLAEALAAEVSALGRRAAIDTGFRVEGDPVDLTPAADVACLRVVQEALTNALKHSRATQVAVSLAYGPDEVRVTIRDNGIGFDPLAVPEASESSGLGLYAMTERAHSAGGSVAVDSQPGAGTTVTIRFPVEGDLR